MYTHIYIYICIYIYTQTYKYINIYIYIYTFTVSLAFSQSRCWSCARVCLFLSLFASTPGSFVHCLECGCESDPELVMEHPGSLVVLMRHEGEEDQKRGLHWTKSSPHPSTFDTSLNLSGSPDWFAKTLLSSV